MNTLRIALLVVVLVSGRSLPALAQDTDNFYFSLAEKQFNEGNILVAVELFNKGLEFDATSALAYYYLGRSLDELGKPREALTHYQKANELDPGSEFGARAYEKIVLISLEKSVEEQERREAEEQAALEAREADYQRRIGEVVENENRLQTLAEEVSSREQIIEEEKQALASARDELKRQQQALEVRSKELDGVKLELETVAANLAERRQEQEALEAETATRLQALEAREKTLQENGAVVAAKEKDVSSREAELSTRSKNLDQREAQLVDRELKNQNREFELSEKESQSNQGVFRPRGRTAQLAGGKGSSAHQTA